MFLFFLFTGVLSLGCFPFPLNPLPNPSCRPCHRNTTFFIPLNLIELLLKSNEELLKDGRTIAVSLVTGEPIAPPVPAEPSSCEEASNLQPSQEASNSVPPAPAMPPATESLVFTCSDIGQNAVEIMRCDAHQVIQPRLLA